MADHGIPEVDFGAEKEIVLELIHPDSGRLIESFPAPPAPGSQEDGGETVKSGGDASLREERSSLGLRSEMDNASLKSTGPSASLRDEKASIIVKEREVPEDEPRLEPKLEPESPPPVRVPAPIVKKPDVPIPLVPQTPARPSYSSPRPLTSSTHRFSLSSGTPTKRRIKYGRGKYALVELVPQPSDDPEDPLNWPTWRKELNFYTLLLCVALFNVMKTAFISVNGILAINYAISYTSAAALTGVPLILSAVTGMASLVAARFWGRRPVYLASMALTFIGSMWNMRVADSYAQCMAARIFQGLGWGAFDTLMLGSIHDTFFEHEHYVKIAIYQIVGVATTWGAPLLGGVVSRHGDFAMQFVVLNVFLSFAVAFLILGAPETSFDRATVSLTQTPLTGWSSKYVPLVPRGTVTKQQIVQYVRDVAPPYSYAGPSVDAASLLQAPCAMVAPTTLVLFVGSFLPHCTLWGLLSSLALLFEPLPFMLGPASLGALLTAPFLLSLAATALLALLPAWNHSFAPRMNTTAIAAGSALFFAGLLAFGLHASDSMLSKPDGSGASSTVFSIDGAAARGVSLPAVSFLLGLAASGACVLDATARPLVRRSAQFTSSSLAAAVRNTTDMLGGLAVWRALFAGVFVLALPNAVWMWEGLRAAAVGISVAQLLVAIAVGAAWWSWDDVFRRVDGRVMRCVDLSLLKRPGSFFDDD